MKSVFKKVVIYSMVGIMQIGLCAAVTEASPLYKDSPRPRAYEQKQNQPDQERMEKERQERERIEREHHEREMKRRPGEDEREWHERQEREKERHDNTMNEIKAGALGVIIGLLINK